MIIDPNGVSHNISYEEGLFLLESQFNFEGMELVKKSDDVWKICNPKKEAYDKKRKQKNQIKPKQTKQVRIQPTISAHDLTRKMHSVVDFLNSGHPVKVEIKLRGRNVQHADKALTFFKDSLKLVDETHEFKIISENGNRNIHTVIKPDDIKRN